MSSHNSVWSKASHSIRALFRRKKAETELDSELRFHLESQIENNIRAGMSPGAARQSALREFGGVELAKEECRDERGTQFLEQLWQDVRFGTRILRKNPGFTAVAVLTLALGIGANTAIFSLINALFLRSLPVKNSQELVMLKWSTHKPPNFHGYLHDNDCRNDFHGDNDNPSGCSFTHPFFNDLRAQTNFFTTVTASGGRIAVEMSGNGPASMREGLLVAGNYFDALGVRPAVGRLIEPSDDQPSAPAVAVLNYSYWQKVFGGSTSVLGKTFRLNGVPTTIIGVAEPRFVSLTPGNVPDAWLPMSLNLPLRPWANPDRDDGGFPWLFIIARLKPEVPRERAQAFVSLLFRNEMLHGAEPLAKESDEPSVELVPAQKGLNGIRGKYSTPLFILMPAVGIVLLIACANVAGLFLARSRVRQKEVALRQVLGAGRWRIVRQLLTESVLLSAFGGLLGILVAIWGVHAILAFVASGAIQPLGAIRPLGFDASIDTHVLLFTLGISLFAGVVFGLAPAMRGTRVELTPAFKEATGNSARAGRGRSQWLNVGNSLVVAQVALTMIVLVGAGLVVRTLQNLRNIDPGFDVTNILNFSVAPRMVGYKWAQMDALYRNLQFHLSAIPGVKSVSYSGDVLLSGPLDETSFHLLGAPDKSEVDSDILTVGPDFFATMKTPLVEGREFSPADFTSASASSTNPPASSPSVPEPAIVNQTFVRRYLGNSDVIGQRFTSTGEEAVHHSYVVIGVVRDAKYGNLTGEIKPTAYIPATDGGTFELRTTANPSSIIPAVQNAINQVDSNLPIFDVMTESQFIDDLLFQERLIARLSSLFGLLALLLACVGLYGLLSYEVTRRTREIGIRMALGAQPGNVLRMVIAQGIALTSVGVTIGIGAALGVTRYLGSILYDVHPGDPITQATVGTLLLIVAFVACWIPARRATQVDPMVALRNE
jgi:predicted permease